MDNPHLYHSALIGAGAGAVAKLSSSKNSLMIGAGAAVASYLYMMKYGHGMPSSSMSTMHSAAHALPHAIAPTPILHPSPTHEAHEASHGASHGTAISPIILPHSGGFGGNHIPSSTHHFPNLNPFRGLYA